MITSFTNRGRYQFAKISILPLSIRKEDNRRFMFHITQIPRTRTNSSGITNRVWYDRWCTGTVHIEDILVELYAPKGRHVSMLFQWYECTARAEQRSRSTVLKCTSTCIIQTSSFGSWEVGQQGDSTYSTVSSLSLSSQSASSSARCLRFLLSKNPHTTS